MSFQGTISVANGSIAGSCEEFPDEEDDKCVYRGRLTVGSFRHSLSDAHVQAYPGLEPPIPASGASRLLLPHVFMSRFSPLERNYLAARPKTCVSFPPHEVRWVVSTAVMHTNLCKYLWNHFLLQPYLCSIWGIQMFCGNLVCNVTFGVRCSSVAQDFVFLHGFVELVYAKNGI